MGRRTTALIAGFLLLGGFLALNMLVGTHLRGVRIDATQGRVYTLTKGSRNIAQSPSEPIRLTLYYTPKLAQGQPQIQAHAQRVQELLQEYERASGGKVVLTIVNPEPFSDAEDAAVGAGLQGLPVNASGDSLYLGMVAVNAADGREVIPFFDPSQERFVEYEVSRIIHTLANPRKHVIGLISSVPMEGGFSIDPRTRQPIQTPAWRIVEEMKATFEVRNLGDGVTQIPADISALMVVHPRGLNDAVLYAIDQYVLGGGRLLAFVDPMYESDPAMDPTRPDANRESELARLLGAWGVEVVPQMVAADRDLALRVRFQGRRETGPLVIWLDVDERGISQTDAITGPLQRVMVPSPGLIRRVSVGEGTTGPGVTGPAATIEPLLTTTSVAMAIPVAAIGLQPDPESLLAGYIAGKEAFTIAARLGGSVKSAFPGGKPRAEGEAAPTEPDATHLSESKGPIQAVIVADVDCLMDQYWVRRENVFGVTMVSRFRDNGALVMGALDNLCGSNDLIAVRARQDTNRPFTVVEDMQRRADQRYAAEKQLLEQKIQQTQQKIAEIEARRSSDPTSTLVLTSEQQAEVDKFKDEFVKTRKELRRVQLNLRQDIESLGTQLKFINIGLVPALVTLGALGLFGLRVNRRRRARVA